MKNEELISIIQGHRDNSLGADDGELSIERAEALDHYHGRAYGNEVEGRSHYVSKDLSEAVDWALPAIMRVFTQSGAICEFEPVGPEDEAAAKQETDYLNQVVMKDNNGFMILYDTVKDTLLLKNGYVKHYWNEDVKIVEEEYDGMTSDDLVMLFNQIQQSGADVEVREQSEEEGLFHVKLRITSKNGKVILDAVPCEEIRVSRRCRGSLQDSPFVEHVTVKTRSDLIEMGMDKDFVYSLPTSNGNSNSSQSLSRDSVTDESNYAGDIGGDQSMDEIDFCEAYIKVDWDGDGIAELRKVVTVGNEIPDGDEWNEQIDACPITGFVSKRVPHRHVGESLDDDLSDLQEIKTVLFRQLLDNIYLTNNNQWLVNDRVNLNDFLTSTPGGIKRVSGMEPVSGSIEPVIVSPILGTVLPVIDYIDSTKEGRTGISKSTTGLDPDVLKQSTKGAFIENLNRASQKIEMITRLLAEGVKEMVLQVHAILMKHQNKARIVRLRGKYTPVNPQEWRERTDLTVKVGLGSGSEDQKREKLMMLVALQKEAAAAGLVGEQQVYNMFADIAGVMGFEMPEKYLISPDSPEFQQKKAEMQQRNPLAEAEQVKAQAQMQVEQVKMQGRSQIEQLNSQLEQVRLQLEDANKKRELDIKEYEAITHRMGEQLKVAQHEFAANQPVPEEKPQSPQVVINPGEAVNAGVQAMHDSANAIMNGFAELTSLVTKPRYKKAKAKRLPDGSYEMESVEE